MPTPRVLSILTAAALALGTATACDALAGPRPTPSANPVASRPADHTLTIAVNVWAVGWLAERIGGPFLDRVVHLESDAHEPPTQADLDALQTADIVILVGKSTEAQHVIDQRWPLASEDRARFIDLSEVPPIRSRLRKAPPELGDDQLPGGFDPHIWLDPQRMKEIADTVQRAVSFVVEAQKGVDGQAPRQVNDTVGQHMAAVKRQLDELTRDMTVGLRPCAGRWIVPEHPAYQYLAEAFGLRQFALTRPSGGRLDPVRAETQRQRLRREVWAGTTEKYLFIEASKGHGRSRRDDPELAYLQQIADEHNAQLLYLSSLETAPSLDGGDQPPDYLAAMRRNGKDLRTGLRCG